jgi:flavin reductase (DIM6/NTAB) family NADH-FMN oxidoreductase RutF
MPGKDITKDVLRLFSYGLYVATSVGREGPRAATLSWVMQASFEPKLIAVAVRKGTAIHDAMLTSRLFGLHVVGGDQPDFAKAFFKVGESIPEAIAGYRFALSDRGVPIFEAAPAWLECEVVEAASEQGDHAVLLARVVGGGVRDLGGPMLALRDTPWHYGG